MKPRIRVSLALAFILVVYGALYAQSRHFDFVWADTDAIRDSRVYDLPFAAEVRTTEHARMNPTLMELHGIALTHEAYRPLLVLSHGLDIAMFGRVPGPMHLHNVLLGALAILAAFWLAARLFGAANPALVVAALFAWHPLHVESICFLSARGDPLAALLALVASALVVEAAPVGGAPRARRTTVALAVAAGVVMLASLFAKEANVFLPLALAGFAVAAGRLRAWRGGLAALAAAVPVYAGLRALLVAHGPAATHADRVTQALVNLPGIFVEYARAFLLPFDMSISRPVYISPLVGWSVVLVAAAAVAAALVALARRDPPSPWRSSLALAAAGVVFAGLVIAPAAVAVFSQGAVADRYAYLAVFGFAVALVAPGARAFEAWPRLRPWLVGATALYAALCVFVSAREIPAWATNGTLYTHAVEVEPHSAGAHYRLGRWLGEEGRWPEAVVEFERAMGPATNDRVLNNLGVAYLNVGRTREAEAVLHRAIERSHEMSFHAFYNLGTAQRALGDLAAACDSYRRALAISPEYAHAKSDLARYCARPN